MKNTDQLQAIKLLRAETGASLSDCRTALKRSQGDIEAALVIAKELFSTQMASESSESAPEADSKPQNPLSEAELKKTRSQLRKLLKSPDPAVVETGLALLLSLAEDPQTQVLLEELCEGCGVDESGKIFLGAEIKKRVRAANRSRIALTLLGLFNRLLSLKKLDLSHSDDWETLPSLGVNCLESLKLHSCRSLKNLGVGNRLGHLRDIILTNCSSLENVDGLAGNTKIESMRFYGCKSLENIDGLQFNRSLKTVSFSDCDALQNVNGLRGCTSLESLRLNAPNVGDLSALKQLPSLKKLVVNDSAVGRPAPNALKSADFFPALVNLEILHLGRGQIPDVESVASLPRLKELFIRDAVVLQGFNRSGFPSLETLQVNDNTTRWAGLDSLKGLTGLKNLTIYSDTLQNVDALTHMKSLEVLSLRSCRLLKRLGDLSGLSHLHTVYLDECTSLQNVDGLLGSTVQRLLIHGCTSLQNVNGLSKATELMSPFAGPSARERFWRVLDLSGCSSLQDVEGLSGLSELEWLKLNDCSALKNLDGLANLSSLGRLEIRNCTGLENIDGIPASVKGAYLVDIGCTSKIRKQVKARGEQA